MVDYVARALAQKALSSSGGGAAINTYSKDEINVLMKENKKTILEDTDLKIEESLTNTIVIEDKIEE